MPGCACPESGRPSIASCLSIAGAPRDLDSWVDETGSPALSVTVAGTVEAVGQAAWDESCFQSVAMVSRSGRSTAGSPAFVAVRDGQGTLWTVGTDLPGALDAFAVGDVVTASFEAGALFGWSLPDMSLMVHRNGSAALWAGQAPSFEALTQPPSYELSLGGSICRDSSECGKWNEYRLAFDGDARGSVGWSAPAAAGSDLIFNGGVAFQTKSSSSCADWSVAEVWAAVVYGASD